MERARWNNERRRKQPSLYDEYLNEEKTMATPNRPFTPDRERNTIRTVTPDTPNARPIVQPKSTQHFQQEFLPLTASPSSSPRSLRKERKETESPKATPRSILTRSGSENGSKKEYTMSGFTPGHTRSRTNTMQDIKGSSSQTRRLRMASFNHGGESAIFGGGKRPSSNGQTSIPSSVSQPAFSSSLPTSPPIPPAPRSPSITRPTSTTPSLSDSMSGRLPSPNAKRILHLMKMLCGRMSGNVYFRRASEHPWTASYCYTQEDSGSLMSESALDAGLHKTLIPDLRGCHVKCVMDETSQTPHLEITVPNSYNEVHLKFSSQSDLDSWFAALLCWQPIRPKGIQDKIAKPQAGISSPQPLRSENRQKLEPLLLREAPVIKVGKMIYWDTSASTFGSSLNAKRPVSSRPQPSRMQSFGSRRWRRVSCTLRENGELKLYTESENALVTVVQLSQLSRCAIQRLDCSVLETNFCIAVYPQYTSNQSVPSPIKPIFLSVETRILYEVWFVLLRAFTIPQLYGPRPPDLDDNDDAASSERMERLLASSSADMFRMERALAIRIVEAKIEPNATTLAPDPNGLVARPSQQSRADAIGGLYVEIHLDGELRGKTQSKQGSQFPFWREDFDYLDLPAVLSSASVLMKHQPADLHSPRIQQELRLMNHVHGIADGAQFSGAAFGYSGISNDQTLGKVEIFLEELEARKDIEKWWPLVNTYGQRVGEILIRARAEENVILMTRDYDPLSKLLRKFDNGLTVQIAQAIPSELKVLSDTLLNIFQVGGCVTDWLMALIEDEIDGTGKETPMTRLRYSRRVASMDSDAAPSGGSEREMLVRDLNKNATLEANLLFRANTLLTKSLDTHMRRVGSDYLASTLGPVIASLNERDPDCEVDPNKVASPHALERNWIRLLAATQEVWDAINSSVTQCPIELKFIFRHIRACAEDRYGDFLRTVSYSSVSGFLFLRFFCPAVLNPKLFNLLKDDPKPRGRRTFTLIAKSLQGLANVASFGSKETWMEPMNAFLNSHREEFKTFIENICFISHPASVMIEKPPSYLTPLAIRNRLPLTSREGFPSLPFLVDEAREYASLVDLWLKAFGNQNRTDGGGIRMLEEGPLRVFHDLCTGLYSRTQECLNRAERAERPSSNLSFRWEELIDSLQGSGIKNATQEPLQDTTPVTRDSFDDVAIRSNTLGMDQSQAGKAAKQDWENDRDAGAASAAASLLLQDRNPRSGLVVPGTSSDAGRTLRSVGNVSIVETLGTSLSKSVSPLDEVSAQEEGQGTSSRPISALSDELSSDGEERTALPSVSTERARRERWARDERDRVKDPKDKDKARLKDFVPGLARRRREKEKDKDKERG